ncbi:MAG: 16S rRNA (cytosine(967)-C(5))-methyltransferase RsmB [Oscillospiraceae bacterium]|nr:16S rRNA (cytosine(967)-C(5))-methyltransferase RsmB [Oscillospiraceae bacterium]
MGDARRAALTVLERCRRAGAWSDAVLGSVLEREQLEERDRALATVICYGVQQNLLLLDYVLQSRSERALNRVEPKILDLLRLSAYQLMFLKKVPASAAVNEAVKLCRALGYARAAGYVNAVLRRVAAAPSVPTELAGQEAEQLSVRTSHPRWLVDELLTRLGPKETEALLECDNAPCPATLRVNTLRATAAELIASLNSEGVRAEPHPVLPEDCVIVRASGDLSATAAFRDGWFFVQDAAAAFSVMAAEPKNGQRILDLCAAPGGKSFSAAVLSGGEASIISCDLHPNKLNRIRESASRLGLTDCIETIAADGREVRPEWEETFDLVLADVPCSGLGVIRKKPDVRWKDPAGFARLPALQLRLLENAGNCLRPGGTLLYSTCTFREEENAGVVSAFLKGKGKGIFTPVDFDSPWGTRSEGGILQLWPQRQGTDGFFIAKLRKQA